MPTPRVHGFVSHTERSGTVEHRLSETAHTQTRTDKCKTQARTDPSGRAHTTHLTFGQLQTSDKRRN